MYNLRVLPGVFAVRREVIICIKHIHWNIWTFHIWEMNYKWRANAYLLLILNYNFLKHHASVYISDCCKIEDEEDYFNYYTVWKVVFWQVLDIIYLLKYYYGGTFKNLLHYSSMFTSKLLKLKCMSFKFIYNNINTIVACFFLVMSDD